jgi:cyclase
VNAEPLSENLYLLRDSQGMGNTVVLTGEDGLLMVDTKGGRSVPKLFAKITELSDKPIRFVIITHWHYDHVGGNETVAGTGATIIAHENVRKHMGMEHRMKLLNVTVPPAPKTARPPLTYRKQVALHMNGEFGTMLPAS